MSVILLGVLTALYASLMLFFTVGLLRTKRPDKRNIELKSVSLVVPIRNEAPCVLKTLEAIAAQDYRGEWEAICVDDRSTDETPAILEEFAKTHPRFTVVHVPINSPYLESPKKRALETGFKIAKNEILMTMDADSLPPEGWVTSMMACFRGNVAIVQGPKQNIGGNGLVYGYQKLETLAYTCMEAAGFSLGMPMVASATALAYKKELFFKVGGFGELVHLSSGDDDMLVHKMIQVPGTGFRYNLDPEAIVDTAPVDRLRGLLNQRARWSSNGTRYTNHAYTFFLTLIYTFLVWLCISPWLALFLGFPWSWFLVPFAVKVAADILFLTTGAIRLRSSRFLKALPYTELMQIPIIVLAVPLGVLRFFKWK
jgi:cellulose synthase/poly-beta-1,6-N-acetylglucosamine synthase-like glycosyltransferase